MGTPIVVKYRSREILAVRRGRQWYVTCGRDSAADLFLQDALRDFVRDHDDRIALTIEILEKELGLQAAGEPTAGLGTVAPQPDEA